jgi:hypothetical protein
MGRRAGRRRRIYSSRSRLSFEALESRRLLAAELLSVIDMADLIRPYLSSIEGLTVVTHGFQPTNTGDSMSSLSHAVYSRADSYANSSIGKNAWLLDYDIRDEATIAGFDIDLAGDDDGENNGSILNGSPSEIIVQFDWAVESNET